MTTAIGFADDCEWGAGSSFLVDRPDQCVHSLCRTKAEVRTAHRSALEVVALGSAEDSHATTRYAVQLYDVSAPMNPQWRGGLRLSCFDDVPGASVGGPSSVAAVGHSAR